MANPMSKADLTLRDVVDGLEAMEKWAHQLRDAVASLDQDQPLRFRPQIVATSPRVSGGQCPPGEKKPKKRKTGSPTKKK